MDKDRPIYQKHNSFVGIRSKGTDAQAVLRRIQAMRGELDRHGLSPEKKQIVLAACDSLLPDSASGAAPVFDLTVNVVEEMARLSDDELPRYLFYRYRYDVFPKTLRLDDFPPCLQIEPTSVCNFRCVFCYQVDEEFTSKAGGHMGMMPLDLFKRVVDEAEGRCEAVTLASRGDPLIAPDFIAMLDYCRGKFLALKVNTNAWILDERKCRALLEAGVNTVVFSADAASEPLYSQLRVGGNLERVVKNVRRFRDIREKHYPGSRTITRVSGVFVDEKQSLDEMEAFWGEMVDQVAFVKYNPWENTYENSVNDVTTPCSDLWRRMFVWFDGRVNPCDVDFKSALAVGNARDQSLAELWRSEGYERLRALHLAKQRSQAFPCNRCTVI